MVHLSLEKYGHPVFDFHWTRHYLNSWFPIKVDFYLLDKALPELPEESSKRPAFFQDKIVFNIITDLPHFVFYIESYGW